MNFWQILGLAPTSDVRAIKRAYAALLKCNRPEDDLQAFQQLRTAYAEALAAAPLVDSDGASLQEIALPEGPLPFAAPKPSLQSHTESDSPVTIPPALPSSTHNEELPETYCEESSETLSGGVPEVQGEEPPETPASLEPSLQSHTEPDSPVTIPPALPSSTHNEELFETYCEESSETLSGGAPEVQGEEPPETPASLEAGFKPPFELPPEPSLRQRTQAQCQEIWARGEQDQEVSPEPFSDYLTGLLRHPAWQAPQAAQALQRTLLESLDSALFNPGAVSWSHAFLSRSLGATIAELAGEHFGWFAPDARKHPQRRLLADLWHIVLQENCRSIAALHDVDQLPAENREILREALQDQLQRPLWQLLDHRQALASQWVAYLNESSFNLPVYEAVAEAWGWDADPLALEALAGANLLQEAVHTRGLLQRLSAQSESHPDISQSVARTLLHPRVTWIDRCRSTSTQIRKAILALETDMPETLQVVAPHVLRFWKKERAVYHDIWLFPTILGGIGSTAYAMYVANSFGIKGDSLVLVSLPATAVGLAMGWLVAYGLASLRLIWKKRIYAAWRNFDNVHTLRIPYIGAKFCAWDIGLTRDLLPFAVLYNFFLTAGFWLDDGSGGPAIPIIAMILACPLYAVWRRVLRQLAQYTNLEQVSEQDWPVAVLLCFFLGFLGIHRFYTGHVCIGLLQLFTLGGCGIWTLIDFILLLTGTIKDAKGLPLRR